MKQIVLPSREESSRFFWMGGQNRSVASSRVRQTVSEFLPGRVTFPPIQAGFRRFRVGVPRGRGCEKDNVIRICRINGDAPQVSMSQPLLESFPGVATVAALEAAVTGR